MKDNTIRISSDWMDHIRLDILRRRPRYDYTAGGERVTNPYTYLVMEAIESLVWRLAGFPLTKDSELVIRIAIEEQHLSFRAIATITLGGE